MNSRCLQEWHIPPELKSKTPEPCPFCRYEFVELLNWRTAPLEEARSAKELNEEWDKIIKEITTDGKIVGDL